MMFENNEDIDRYKIDMWCFGELVLRALTGKPSFNNHRELDKWRRTGEGYPDQLLQDLQVTEGAIDFLHSVMACDPAVRPTAEAACGHTWWAETDTGPARGPSGLPKPDHMSVCSASEENTPFHSTVSDFYPEPTNPVNFDFDPFPWFSDLDALPDDIFSADLGVPWPHASPPEQSQAIFGQSEAPVETPEGWHLVQLPN